MKSRARILIAALTAWACTQASAVPNVPAPPQARPLLITGATLHTVSGAVIPDGRMLIDKGRIVFIGGAADALPSVANAQVLNLSGKHVYPGFISANSVLGLTEVASVRATRDSTEVGNINPNVRALVAVNPDSELIPVARANGVLAALAVPQGGNSGLINGTSALIQLDGWTWEEMGLAPAVGLHISLPTMRFNAELFPPPLDAQLDEARKLSASRLQTLEQAFENATAYRKALRAGEVKTPDARWEAMLPVLDGKRQVFVQAADLAQIRYALAFAERFGLKLVIVGGDDAWRIADVLRERQVPVVIAGVHKLPQRRGETYDAAFTLAALLSKAGVRFCIARPATDFEAATERNLPFEAATAAAYGLDPAEALKAITLYPAQILGVADQLGSLETGRLASFMVTDGDPLDIRTRVEQVFIQGRDVDLSTRHTTLYNKYREKYKQLGKP